jgi:putative flippase GtrA
VTDRRTVTRFAAVGAVNTVIDSALFVLLHARLGVVAANLVSTSAGMAFSFLANGAFTFASGRPTLRRAALFLVTTGATMWLLQPLLITGLLGRDMPVVAAKLLAIGACVVVNFAAYRWVVWPKRRPSPAAGGTSATEPVARTVAHLPPPRRLAQPHRPAVPLPPNR